MFIGGSLFVASSSGLFGNTLGSLVTSDQWHQMLTFLGRGGDGVAVALT
jgi:hypothetical protein